MSLIKIVKSKSKIYKWSVDGNKYGTDYDHTVSYGFADENLIKEGYKEILAINGSLFYEYDNAFFACGVEKSRGINNQELEMDCVTKYNGCMSVACIGEELVFCSQKWLIENKIEECYGAITGLGLLMSGKVRNDLHKGFETQWDAKAKRNVIGEDIEGNILSYIEETPITCAALAEKVKELGFYNALAVDGGGSIWRRYNENYTHNTSRKVKNALILYAKDKEDEYQEKYESLKKAYNIVLESNEELARKQKELVETVVQYMEASKEATNKNIDDFIKMIKEV